MNDLGSDAKGAYVDLEILIVCILSAYDKARHVVAQSLTGMDQKAGGTA